MNMIKKVTNDEINAWVKEFAQLKFTINDNAKKLGRSLCEMLDRDPDTFDKIVDASRGQIKFDNLIQFEAIGRGVVTIDLLIESPGVARRLLSMPTDQASQIVKDGGVDVLVRVDDGDDKDDPKFRREFVTLEKLSPSKASQVFGPDGLLSISKQKQLLTAKAAEPEYAPRYTWNPNTGVIHFNEGVSFQDWELKLLADKIATVGMMPASSEQVKSLVDEMKRNQIK